MNSRWKEAVAWVETLDEAKREELAEVVLDHMSEAGLKAKIDKATDSYRAGRCCESTDTLWDELATDAGIAKPSAV